MDDDPNPGSCGYSLASSSPEINSFTDESNVSKVYWEAVSNGNKGELQEAEEMLKLIINGNFDEKYSPLALLAYYKFSNDEKKNGESKNFTLNDLLLKVQSRSAGDLLKHCFKENDTC